MKGKFILPALTTVRIYFVATHPYPRIVTTTMFSVYISETDIHETGEDKDFDSWTTFGHGKTYYNIAFNKKDCIKI